MQKQTHLDYILNKLTYFSLFCILHCHCFLLLSFTSWDVNWYVIGENLLLEFITSQNLEKLKNLKGKGCATPHGRHHHKIFKRCHRKEIAQHNKIKSQIRMQLLRAHVGKRFTVLTKTFVYINQVWLLV